MTDSGAVVSKPERTRAQAVVSSPITHLLGDLPLTPNLAGNLVTANINLWMGAPHAPALAQCTHARPEVLLCSSAWPAVVVLG